MSTTTATVNATITTTTDDEMYPWATPCAMRAARRFRTSRIARDLRRFVALAREVEELAHDLAERMPDSEVLNAYCDDLGGQFADDLTAGVWGLKIAADLVESEMPPTARRRRRPAAKKATTPAAIPLVGVLDARTPAEREADEAAGRSWEDVAAEVINGTAPKLEPKKTRVSIPKAVSDRMSGKN